MRRFVQVCLTFIPAIAAFALSALSMQDAVAEQPATALEQAVFISSSENPSAGCIHPEAGCRAGGCNGQCDGNCGAGCGCGCSESGCPLGLDDWLNGDSSMLSSLKDQSIGECWTWSMGGELRYRYMDEQNRLRPPGPQRTRYDLWRFTPGFGRGNNSQKIPLSAIAASTYLEAHPIAPIQQAPRGLAQAGGSSSTPNRSRHGSLSV
ncbi:MAG: hypothetical protein H8E37_12745, partial [Planctomycetes bacterium]|nr:hypothetical protein [Planctomycetota bacterium]